MRSTVGARNRNSLGAVARETKTRETKTRETKTRETKTSETKTSETKTSEAKISQARIQSGQGSVEVGVAPIDVQQLPGGVT